ncbi:hypothetical protein V1478_015209 [Vespula squamosa]|uniref:Uncharacterized protein n=1 Tax=Vespula squamosa TaxID=30214 RepID=A0ABD2A4H6_VESSQ
MTDHFYKHYIFNTEYRPAAKAFAFDVGVSVVNVAEDTHVIMIIVIKFRSLQYKKVTLASVLKNLYRA